MTALESRNLVSLEPTFPTGNERVLAAEGFLNLVLDFTSSETQDEIGSTRLVCPLFAGAHHPGKNFTFGVITMRFFIIPHNISPLF